jgi:uncharacterized protein (TIGR00304 family)
MNKIQVLSAAICTIGIIFVIVGALQGDIHGGVFLIFPFFIGSGLYSFFGILLLMVSLLLFISGFTPRKSIPQQLPPNPETREEKPTTKGGGIVLIGPIPIIVGSSWKIALTLILTTIVLSVILYFLFYYR